MTSENLSALAAHVIRTLPDSIAQRGPILDALLEFLPESHNSYREFAEMKIHLEQHELLRSQISDHLNPKGAEEQAPADEPRFNPD